MAAKKPRNKGSIKTVEAARQSGISHERVMETLEFIGRVAEISSTVIMTAHGEEHVRPGLETAARLAEGMMTSATKGLFNLLRELNGQDPLDSDELEAAHSEGMTVAVAMVDDQGDN